LINGAGENTLRFVPPLVISEQQVDDALARLDRVTRTVLEAR
jgi:acetylornithine/succinyldiaminopimelate/putrescine aminotransferase